MEEKGGRGCRERRIETVMTERRQDSRGAQQRLESSQSGETAMALAYNLAWRARVAEWADALDLKSSVPCDVWVQIPPRALMIRLLYQVTGLRVRQCRVPGPPPGD